MKIVHREGGCRDRRSDFGGGGFLDATKESADTSDQFLGSEGFGDVVVGPQFEADDFVDLFGLCA